MGQRDDLRLMYRTLASLLYADERPTTWRGWLLRRVRQIRRGDLTWLWRKEQFAPPRKPFGLETLLPPS